MRLDDFVAALDRNLGCKTTYTIKEENTGRLNSSVDVPCKEALEHLDRLYREQRKITFDEVTITKYVRFLPFLKATIPLTDKMSSEQFSRILKQADNLSDKT